MSAVARLRPGDGVLLRGRDGGGALPFVVVSRSATGWLLRDGRGTVCDRSDAEIVDAAGGGRLVHLPFGGITPQHMRLMLPAPLRAEADRRLDCVLQVKELLAGGMPLMAACAAVAEGSAANGGHAKAGVHGDGSVRARRSPSSIRLWHRAWSLAGESYLALASQAHLRGNRTPRLVQPTDGTPGPRVHLDEVLARVPGAGRGAGAEAFRSYLRECEGMAVAPVSESTFRRAFRAYAGTPAAVAADPEPPNATASGTASRRVSPPATVVAHPEFLRCLSALSTHDQARSTARTTAHDRILLLTGGSGVGLSKALATYVGMRAAGGAGDLGEALLVEAPIPAYRPGLGAAILRSYGLTPGRGCLLDEEALFVDARLRAHGVGLVLVDKAHLILGGSSEHRERSVELLSKIVASVDARFILAGDPSLLELRELLGAKIRHVHEMRPYEPDGASGSNGFADLAAGLARAKGLSWPTLPDPTLCDRLCAASGGAFGGAERLLSLLAAEGGALNAASLAAIEAGDGTADPDLNPFLCMPQRLPEIWSDRREALLERTRARRPRPQAGSGTAKATASRTANARKAKQVDGSMEARLRDNGMLA